MEEIKKEENKEKKEENKNEDIEIVNEKIEEKDNNNNLEENKINEQINIKKLDSKIKEQEKHEKIVSLSSLRNNNIESNNNVNHTSTRPSKGNIYNQNKKGGNANFNFIQNIKKGNKDKKNKLKNLLKI